MTDQFNPWANVPMQEAMPFGAGATPEGSPTGLSNMISGLMSMPKHLIDKASEFDPKDIHGSSERVTPAAAQMALALAGNGAPAAEAGAAGMFGGRLAQTADLRALQEAERMRMGGKHPADVKGDTGWFMSPMDYKWRFEIPDNKMALKYMPNEGETARGSVASLVSHPEAFNAYPELQKQGLQLTRDFRHPTGTGMYSPIHPDLKGLLLPSTEVSAPNMQIGRSVAAHELQHGIQDIEGFAFGGNPGAYAHALEQGMRSGGAKSYDFNEIAKKSNDFYHRTAGEVEARNVQNRLDYSPTQRAAIPPWETQDVPYNKQLLIEALKDFK